MTFNGTTFTVDVDDISLDELDGFKISIGRSVFERFLNILTKMLINNARDTIRNYANSLLKSEVKTVIPKVNLCAYIKLPLKRGYHFAFTNRNNLFLYLKLLSRETFVLRNVLEIIPEKTN